MSILFDSARGADVLREMHAAITFLCPSFVHEHTITRAFVFRRVQTGSTNPGCFPDRIISLVFYEPGTDDSPGSWGRSSSSPLEVIRRTTFAECFVQFTLITKMQFIVRCLVRYHFFDCVTAWDADVRLATSIGLSSPIASSTLDLLVS